MKVLVIDAFIYFASIQGQYCAQVLIKSAIPCNYVNSGWNLSATQNQNILNYIDLAALLFTILSCVYFTVFRRKLSKMQDWLDFN